MNWLVIILNKVYLLLFFMATLNVIRYVFNILLSYKIGVKYDMSNRDVTLFMLSLATVLMVIFTGIKLL